MFIDFLRRIYEVVIHIRAFYGFQLNFLYSDEHDT
jgi:hypothetical protein